jgi:hypothetical protein
MSLRRHSLVLDHHPSALGAGGIRCFDWTRSPGFVAAGYAAAGGASYGLAIAPGSFTLRATSLEFVLGASAPSARPQLTGAETSFARGHRQPSSL